MLVDKTPCMKKSSSPRTWSKPPVFYSLINAQGYDLKEIAHQPSHALIGIHTGIVQRKLLINHCMP